MIFDTLCSDNSSPAQVLHPIGTEWYRKGTHLSVARVTYPWIISGRYSVKIVMRNKILHKSILASSGGHYFARSQCLQNRGYIVGSLHKI
jgi:hypothetical protein